ncbi:DUF2239 family protein [Cytobacillus sp. FSL M8-0252]|uniref:DUF2239 family protein n=1 Tax=Cytobacillus sp. FSL M8-0252 TaxID=2921621 RepID=UPI0030F570F3
MFVIRGGDGQIVVSTAWDETNGKEIQYETYEQAEQALNELKKSLPKDLFKIEATKCERCNGNNDLAIIHVNDEAKAYCQDCRVEMFTKKRTVGRPSVGITKKVSLTLPEEEWNWLDKQAEGNRSQYLRRLVWEAQSSEYEWSNNASLGYAILGAKNLGYTDKQIEELVRAIYREFDMKTLDEAKKVYNQSPY